MDWLLDSRACLYVSKIMLNEIEATYQKSLDKEERPATLMVTIKNFLENIRSSLDYPANYIFNTYCLQNYTKKELGRLNVYFPIFKERQPFNEGIERSFKGLLTVKPEIVNVFEKCQAFQNQDWTQYLKILSNENKHRNLSKQKRKEIATHVHYMEDLSGIRYANNLLISSRIADVVINGLPVNSLTAEKHPYLKNFNGTFYIDFIFDDINQSVLPTLKNIYAGATAVINELDRLLTENEVEKNIEKDITVIKETNRTFENQQIILDDTSWYSCEFKNCHIIIKTGDFRVERCTFNNCKLILDGNAITIVSMIELFFPGAIPFANEPPNPF